MHRFGIFSVLRACSALGILALWLGASNARAQIKPFPQPAGLKADVAFWVRVYSELDTTQGVLHDGRALGIVYEQLQELPPGFSDERRALIDERIEAYRERLRHLAAPGAEVRDAEDSRLLALWKGRDNAARFQAAADNIRFQSGQADHFRQGLERSGAWRPQIERLLREAQLPIELAALPYVESAFDPSVYSKVGAAGLWQLMPSTARLYLRVDEHVDQRLDPLASTAAAIAYFRDAFARLESWPLAVISYNHGVNGMDRARRQLGTSDVVRILRNYQSPSFKFASRNFYPSFLAALEVERNAQKLFGPIASAAAWQTCTAAVVSDVPVASIIAVTNNSVDELRVFNPALRASVWEGQVPVPAGYSLRLPLEALHAAGLHAAVTIEWLQGQSWRAEHVPVATLYVVRPGDTVTRISAALGATPSELIALNKLQRPDLIKAGDRLVTPATQICETCPCSPNSISTPTLAQVTP